MARTKEAAPAPKNLPSHGVFVVEDDGPNAFWTPIGCAWAHADGQGYNVALSAIPVGGRIVIRAKKQQ